MDTNQRHRQSTSRDGPADPDALRRRLRRRGTEIKRRQLATAVRRLEADGELSEDQRAVVAEMADRITEGLLAAPTAALREADRTADADELAALARLFGAPEGE